MRVLHLFLLYITIMSAATNYSFSQIPKKAETAHLDGTDIYYEVYGKGKPLFLLHAFTQSSKSWLPYINDYANDYEVYLVDLKGHGRSSSFKEKVSVRSAAEDLHSLIKYLKISSIDAIGYSYGGEILYQLAIGNPNLINSMIIIGSCGTWNAKDFPEFVEYLSYQNIDNLPWVREQQTDEARVKSILDQVPNYEINIRENELKNIRTRTLLVVGDGDPATPLDCVVKTKINMPNAYLWVLPNTAHGAHKDKNKAEFVRLSKEFLDQIWANEHD